MGTYLTFNGKHVSELKTSWYWKARVALFLLWCLLKGTFQGRVHWSFHWESKDETE